MGALYVQHWVANNWIYILSKVVFDDSNRYTVVTFYGFEYENN